MRKLLVITLIVAISNGATHAHPFHARRRSMQSPYLKDSCSFSCDDLTSFVTLAKYLDDKEPEREVATIQSGFNSEEIIMKLVNALIYATTHRIQNHCHCSHSVTPSLPLDTSHSNGGSPTRQQSNSGHDHANNGLVNLDLLDPNRKNNVLDLDISNQHVVGVGLGTRNQDENSYTYNKAYKNINGNEVSSAGRSSATSSEGLLNVSLLDSKQPNNVAAVSIGRQNVVGVGLGGSNEPNGYRGQSGTQDNNKLNDSLANLQVLNPNIDNNVANLAVGGQNVVGVGLGN